MSKGLLLWTDDQKIADQARGHGLPSTKLEAGNWKLEAEYNLIVGPGVSVPWHLVDAGFRNLARWEAAAPLLERDTAEDLGRAGERRQTAEVVRDLRVPAYACELLFVRDCENGRALIDAWNQEMTGREERRLAFLRALYRVKPIFLALPRSWLRPAPEAQASARQQSAPRREMVHVEVAPGRYVCCLPEEVEKYKQRFALMRAGRRG